MSGDVLPIDIPPYRYGRVYDGPIARFADSGIQASINAAVAGLEADKHLAVVAFVDQSQTVRLATVARVGDRWSAVGVLEHRPLGGWSAEGAIRWSI